MTPAEELRAAAKLMKQRASAATPGPWFVHEQHGRDIADEAWSDERVAARSSHQDVAITYMTSVLEGDPHESNGRFIASWHPGVALAVAGWLDSVADRDGLVMVLVREEWDAALKVARAYLGTGEAGR